MKKIRQRHLAAAALTYVTWSLQVAACLIITGCSKNFVGIGKEKTSARKEATTNNPVEAATAGERTAVQLQAVILKHKVAEAATDKEKAAIGDITQSLQQAKAHTQKKLTKLLSRRRRGAQGAANKNHAKAKCVIPTKKIAACKAHKAHTQGKAAKMLANHSDHGVLPTKDHADTDIQISFIQKDYIAARLVEAARDNTDTTQHDNAKWSSNVCSEFTAKKGRRVLEGICINKCTDIARTRHRMR